MPEEAAPELTARTLPSPTSEASSPLEEDERVPAGTPILQVDASVIRAHHRRLVGAVVRGELHGWPLLELEVLSLPPGAAWPGPPEAEWRALLLALRAVRGERRYPGPLHVLTDARTTLTLWDLAQETDDVFGAPPEAWRQGTTVEWVPRKQIAEADRALHFWMAFLTPSLLGANLPDLASALGAPRLVGVNAAFRVRLSLTGREVHAWVETASDDAGAEFEDLSVSSERK